MSFVRTKHVMSLRISSKRLPPALLERVRLGLNWLLGFHKFDKVYHQLPPCAPADFSQVFLDAMEMRTEFDGEPIDAIPSTGPLILIANHPFGIVDGLALDAMLQSIRPDVTSMTVHQFSAVPEWRARQIFVGPPQRHDRQHLSFRGWRQAFRWIAHGGAIVLFPAGRVALFQWRRMAVLDRPWSPHIATIARRTGAPVLPVFVHGRNGLRFQLASCIHPQLQNLMVVGEAAKMRGRTLRATVGQLVQPQELTNFTTDEQAIEFLRQRTETLAPR
jgi:putative hemolysin